MEIAVFFAVMGVSGVRLSRSEMEIGRICLIISLQAHYIIIKAVLYCPENSNAQISANNNTQFSANRSAELSANRNAQFSANNHFLQVKTTFYQLLVKS
jgi:hypothetical protein